MKYQLEVNGCQGYSAGQVKGVTIGDLKTILDGYDDDDEIIIHDESNSRGASYGNLALLINECAEESEDF